ncbi:hypothetical protein TPY_0824 [Sulfobacillus acidophilus TPY]|uniref:Uncharacterized protein n=1 Tax=Sulfobacillus acidophilus (strain ATCC 700253 / DSM 10332 / NAL) TaxID=679936 RepID=G8TYL7_SULAD|nr:hypothetical protein TPY_0824 [Sulfobacillus acidophilus TPY]AEW06278.1 hypothetical protein Sulac_2817 [Sulfobacillus acidophilus DSM 10332]
MEDRYREFEAVLRRVPHIDHAEIISQDNGDVEVRVVSHSESAPRQVLREIVALLRSYGWTELNPEQIVMVKTQSPELSRPSMGRLKIGGYAVGFHQSGYRAESRLYYGERQYHGEAVSATVVLAMAGATLNAVNQALGPAAGLHVVEAKELPAAGRTIALIVVGDADGEVMAGNAVVYDTLEDAVIRAVLDAINRRFILYSGQKV